MAWSILAIIAIIGWIIYQRRKGKLTLTKEQAELVRDLITKERVEIEKKRQAIIDEGAGEGNTLPIDNLFAHVQNKEFIEFQKERLLGKYGPNIPVDVAYRLMKEFDPDEQAPWSLKPGCYERHLQRREGNLLFPKERRTVTQNEIDRAREKDNLELKAFAAKSATFMDEMPERLKKLKTLTEGSAVLREVQVLISELASLGGETESRMDILLKLEDQLIRDMSQVMPEGAALLREAHDMEVMNRNEFLAQQRRKDSPILPDETVPALLSEDLETISFVGYISRTFGPNFKPNEEDVKKCLGEAVLQGLSQKRAMLILQAWNRDAATKN